MITCKEASRLLSLSLDRPLPRSRRLALRAHLAVCDLCVNYGVQIRRIRDWFRKLAGLGF